MDLAQSVAPEYLKKEECWAVVKAAVEKDWGAEVPPAFKIMYPRPAPTRAVQPPLNISQ